ncbi:MerR family DNA-binding transcriptional regulator [Streptomyces sp. NPDC056149]|uniref:helix-turn-helix domain-containing protein n=1 Tax=Streptomyces sp. NPDC056149 TaxID=3345728 RepID=UPI0035D75372
MAWGIGELARRVGVTVRTARHYPDAGLSPEAGRGAGGHRRYGADAVARRHRIRDLRAVGMPPSAPAWPRPYGPATTRASGRGGGTSPR